MKKGKEAEADVRPEYDLSHLKEGTRGRYSQRYRERTNQVLLEPDVAAPFADDESVNEMLRLLLKIARR